MRRRVGIGKYGMSSINTGNEVLTFAICVCHVKPKIVTGMEPAPEPRTRWHSAAVQLSTVTFDEFRKPTSRETVSTTFTTQLPFGFSPWNLARAPSGISGVA